LWSFLQRPGGRSGRSSITSFAKVGHVRGLRVVSQFEIFDRE
jgi:hypothetical protein